MTRRWRTCCATRSRAARTRWSCSPATGRWCSARWSACSGSPRRRAPPASPWPPSDGARGRGAGRGAGGRGAGACPGGRRARDARPARAAEPRLLCAPRARGARARGRHLARARGRPGAFPGRPPGAPRPHARRGDRARRRPGGALSEPALPRARGHVAGRRLPPRLGALPRCAAHRRRGEEAGAPPEGGRGLLAVPARERGARDLRRQPLRPRPRLPRPRRHGEGDRGPLRRRRHAAGGRQRARLRPEILYLDAGCRLNTGQAREAAERFATLLREFPDSGRARDAAYYRFRALDVARASDAALTPAYEQALDAYLSAYPRAEGAAEARYLLAELHRPRGGCKPAGAEHGQGGAGPVPPAAP